MPTLIHWHSILYNCIPEEGPQFHGLLASIGRFVLFSTLSLCTSLNRSRLVQLSHTCLCLLGSDHHLARSLCWHMSQNGSLFHILVLMPVGKCKQHRHLVEGGFNTQLVLTVSPIVCTQCLQCVPGRRYQGLPAPTSGVRVKNKNLSWCPLTKSKCKRHISQEVLIYKRECHR